MLIEKNWVGSLNSPPKEHPIIYLKLQEMRKIEIPSWLLLRCDHPSTKTQIRLSWEIYNSNISRGHGYRNPTTVKLRKCWLTAEVVLPSHQVFISLGIEASINIERLPMTFGDINRKHRQNNIQNAFGENYCQPKRRETHPSHQQEGLSLPREQPPFNTSPDP